MDIKKAIKEVNSWPLYKSQAMDLVSTIPPEAHIPWRTLNKINKVMVGAIAQKKELIANNTKLMIKGLVRP